MEGNYSLADIAAATGENGFGGNNLIYIIALMVLLFGGFGFGGRGDYGQFATAASQQEILFGQQFQGLDNKIDRIGNGIADATYALSRDVTTEGRNIQMQLADCCCRNQKNVDDLRYEMSNFFAAINSNIDNKYAASQLQAKDAELARVKEELDKVQLQQALCGIPRINTFGFGIVPNFCNGNGCGYVA